MNRVSVVEREQLGLTRCGKWIASERPFRGCAVFCSIKARMQVNKRARARSKPTTAVPDMTIDCKSRLCAASKPGIIYTRVHEDRYLLVLCT